jgi:hypothetical protein
MTRFRDLAEQVRAELPQREIILDGEIVAIGAEGQIDFWELMRGRATLAYHTPAGRASRVRPRLWCSVEPPPSTRDSYPLRLSAVSSLQLS